MIKESSALKKTSPSGILFEEWSTSGRRRPTIGDLLECLIRIPLYRAADFIAINILNEEPPKRPDSGPAKRIDISIPIDIKAIESQLANIHDPKTSTLQNIMPSTFDNVNMNYNVDINLDQHKISLPENQLSSKSFVTISTLTDSDGKPSIETNSTNLSISTDIDTSKDDTNTSIDINTSKTEHSNLILFSKPTISESELPVGVHTINERENLLNSNNENIAEQNNGQNMQQNNINNKKQEIPDEEYSVSGENFPSLSVLKIRD